MCFSFGPWVGTGLVVSRASFPEEVPRLVHAPPTVEEQGPKPSAPDESQVREHAQPRWTMVLSLTALPFVPQPNQVRDGPSGDAKDINLRETPITGSSLRAPTPFSWFMIHSLPLLTPSQTITHPLGNLQ